MASDPKLPRNVPSSLVSYIKNNQEMNGLLKDKRATNSSNPMGITQSMNLPSFEMASRCQESQQ